MKGSVRTVALVALCACVVLVACSGQPSESVVQTAIALT